MKLVTMRKKILFIFIMIMLAVGCCSCRSSAHASGNIEVLINGTFGSVKWYIRSDGTLFLEPEQGKEGQLDSVELEYDDYGDYKSSNIPWTDSADIIKQIVVPDGCTIKLGESAARLFAGCRRLKNFSFSQIDTAETENLSYFFSDCTNLEDVDMTNISTEKVYDMRSMFLRCDSLTELDLSAIDTSNVKFATGMFNECYRLKKLDLSGFNTDSIIKLDHMFWNCDSLSNLICDNEIIIAEYMEYQRQR